MENLKNFLMIKLHVNSPILISGLRRAPVKKNLQRSNSISLDYVGLLILFIKCVCKMCVYNKKVQCVCKTGMYRIGNKQTNELCSVRV